MKSPLPNSQARATWLGFAPMASAMFRGDVPHDPNRIHVGVEILAMEARIELARVLRCIYQHRVDRAVPMEDVANPIRQNRSEVQRHDQPRRHSHRIEMNANRP